MKRPLVLPFRRPAAPLAATALLIGLGLSLAPSPLRAQESSLEGRDLNPVSEAGDAVANMIVGLLGSPPKGKITRVTVVEDREKSLRLEVAYEGYEGNWLRAEVQREGDRGPDEIPEIRAEPVEMDESGVVTLELALADDVPEGSEFESDRLALTVTKEARRRSGALSNFYLQKTWRSAVRAENVIVQVFSQSLQPTATGYVDPPPPGQPFVPGARDEEVEFEYLAFHTDDGRYLSARKGGGGALELVKTGAPGPHETFEVGWLDPEADLARIRTSDGWHLVAVRESSADAATIDPADPATVLQLDYRGDGAYVIYQAPAAARARYAEDAGEKRLQVFVPSARPAVLDLARRLAPLRAGRSEALRITPSRTLGKQSAGGSSARIALRHEPKVGAGTFAESRVRDYFFRQERLDGPQGADEPRPGDAEGPGHRTLDLASVLYTPAYTSGRGGSDGPSVGDMLGVKSLVWFDRNETSGIYYFLPSAYYLVWDPDRGRYALDVEYLAAGPGEEPQALIQATLAPRVGRRERRAIEVLTRRAAFGLGHPFLEVRAMPISNAATTDQVSRQLAVEIQADSVWVAHPGGALEEVRMGWRMPQRRLDNLIEVLRSGQGFQPTLTLRPKGWEEGEAELVDLHLNWLDQQSYPGDIWENGAFWRNELPHPVHLKSLQAMVLDTEERATLLSWDLSGTSTIPPGARAGMDQALTRPVLEHNFFSWVEYSVLPDEASTEAAVRSILGGVSESLQQSLEVTLLDPISATGADILKLYVKSRFLSPDGASSDLRVLTFDHDGQTESIPLYLGRAEDEVPYEWTASLVTPEGEYPEGGPTRFVPGDRDLQLILSSSALREALGGLPDDAGGE